MRNLKETVFISLSLAAATFIAVSVIGCTAGPNEVLTNPPVFGYSADNLHCGWVLVNEKKKMRVVIDGRPADDEFDEITALIFSADGRRHAYPARIGSEWRLVADGRIVGPAADEISPACIVFSPDGGRLAYGIRQGKDWRVVLDEEPDTKSAYERLSSFTFSLDGRRFAYAAAINSRQAVIVDGIAGRFYDETGEIVFSADGKRVAYAATEQKRQFIVMDGREGRRYEWTGTPVFSFDGRRSAYAAAFGRKRFVVTDGGKEGPAYEMDLNIEPVIFGHRDQRLAYAVQKDGTWRMVVDGREGPGYVDIARESFVFNPTGEGFAYVAAVQGAWVVAEDGRRSPSYDETAGGGFLSYSNDGRHLLYGARLNKKWFVVLDGNAGPTLDYNEIGAPLFSPDGAHIVFTGRKNKKWFVVVDGAAGPAYDRIHRFSLTDDGVEYLAERDADDSLLRCRRSFSGDEAGKTIERRLGALPKEDPAEICKPCRQHSDEDE